jgi:hypothetical protein
MTDEPWPLGPITAAANEDTGWVEINVTYVLSPREAEELAYQLLRASDDLCATRRTRAAASVLARHWHPRLLAALHPQEPSDE